MRPKNTTALVMDYFTENEEKNVWTCSALIEVETKEDPDPESEPKPSQKSGPDPDQDPRTTKKCHSRSATLVAT
jgi:hypothetical protein